MSATARPPRPAAERTAVLELQGVSKAFGPVQALTNVDLRLLPGQVHCLAGRERGRQVHPHQGPHRRPPGRRGHVRDRRRAGHHAHARRPAGGRGAGRLPGAEPAPAPVGGGEPVHGPAAVAPGHPRPGRPQGPGPQGARRGRPRQRLARRHRRAAARRHPPAGGDRQGPHRRRRSRSSSSTSRPPPSPRPSRSGCMEHIKRLRERRGGHALRHPPAGGDVRDRRLGDGAARRRPVGERAHGRPTTRTSSSRPWSAGRSRRSTPTPTRSRGRRCCGCGACSGRPTAPPSTSTCGAGEILGIGGLLGSGRSELLLSLFGATPIVGRRDRGGGQAR